MTGRGAIFYREKEQAEARRAAFGQSIMLLQQASGVAVDTLLEIMGDPEAPAACRLRAAESVLEHAADGIAIEDLEARVAALER